MDRHERRLVVITDSDLDDAGIQEETLAAAGFEAQRAACRTADDVIAAAADACALIVQWAPITGEVLDHLPSCRFISRLGIGYDMIDVEAASSHGVAVANTPDYCVEEVATHTIAMILAGARRIVDLDRSVRAGRWAIDRDARRPSSSTLAVIGFGRIGSRTAEAARALGFRVLVHDPFVSSEKVAERGHEPVTREQALSEADIVSLHVPLTEATRGLLDAETLALMQPGAFVVNTCRGGLIEEDALANALHSGQIGGAALDVFANEPLPDDSPLRDTPNTILTPHAAWYSSLALAELPVIATQQVVEFFAGGKVPSIVNRDYLDATAAGSGHGG